MLLPYRLTIGTCRYLLTTTTTPQLCVPSHFRGIRYSSTFLRLSKHHPVAKTPRSYNKRLFLKMTSTPICKKEEQLVMPCQPKMASANLENVQEAKLGEKIALIPSLSRSTFDRTPLETVSNTGSKREVKPESLLVDSQSMPYNYKLIADAQRRHRRIVERIESALDEWRPTIHAGSTAGTAIESPAPVANENGNALGTNSAKENVTTSGDEDMEDSYIPDPYQQAAISAAEARESFFLTGSAGTGKSYVLKKVIKLLRAKGLEVAVTASTGCAAVAINGNTVHSATGIGLGKEPAEVLERKARTSGRMRELLNSIDVLVLDEVSMIDSILFDKLELIFSTARAVGPRRGQRAREEWLRKRMRTSAEHSGKPFGGAQVIVCGDFFQLPPVAASDYELQYSKEKYFAFESAAWKKTIKKSIMLRVVHRQSDRNFVGLLNEIRYGVVSDCSRNVLEACQTNTSEQTLEIKPNGDPVPFTKLYSHRKQVDIENYTRLHKIKDYPGVKYIARDTIEEDKLGSLTRGAARALLSQVQGLDLVELKERCRVLCVKNIDKSKGIVNGSTGYLVGFMLSNKERQISVEEWGKMSAKERQERYEEIAARAGLRKLSLRDKELQEKFRDAARDPTDGFMRMDGEHPDIVPVVRFDNGVEMPMAAQRWEVYGTKGQIVAWRSQIPLTLGWALSIHKSQGMSLQHVQTELARAFDFGQVYVAISRATSAQGLRLTTFDRNRVMTHEKVEAFYARLEQEDAKRAAKRKRTIGQEDQHQQGQCEHRNKVPFR